MDVGHIGVVLIGDITEELLNEVLQRHQSSDSAVLVHDHGQVVLLPLQETQRVISVLTLGDKQRGLSQCRDGFLQC